MRLNDYPIRQGHDGAIIKDLFLDFPMRYVIGFTQTTFRETHVHCQGPEEAGRTYVNFSKVDGSINR